jgi:hypothetical protein
MGLRDEILLNWAWPDKAGKSLARKFHAQKFSSACPNPSRLHKGPVSLSGSVSEPFKIHWNHQLWIQNAVPCQAIRHLKNMQPLHRYIIRYVHGRCYASFRSAFAEDRRGFRFCSIMLSNLTGSSAITLRRRAAFFHLLTSLSDELRCLTSMLFNACPWGSELPVTLPQVAALAWTTKTIYSLNPLFMKYLPSIAPKPIAFLLWSCRPLLQRFVKIKLRQWWDSIYTIHCKIHYKKKLCTINRIIM